jgi:hypothetical protein
MHTPSLVKLLLTLIPTLPRRNERNEDTPGVKNGGLHDGLNLSRK